MGREQLGGRRIVKLRHEISLAQIDARRPEIGRWEWGSEIGRVVRRGRECGPGDMPALAILIFLIVEPAVANASSSPI